jgi:hypothetical protein
MPVALADVRSRGQTGKHLLVMSISGFDPKRTIATRRRRLVRLALLRDVPRLINKDLGHRGLRYGFLA